jgi:hypothetical protein
MLEKDRDLRYRSCGEVIADLEKAMEKYRLTRDRRRLVSYINDPDAYDTKYKERTVNRCLSQGAFYMKKGESRLEEAILEFKRILYLDPNNERARKNLDRIQKQKSRNQTVTVVTTPKPAARHNGINGRDEDERTPANKKHKSVRVVAAGSGASRKRGGAGKAIGGVAAAVLVLAAGWFAHQRGLLSIDLLRSGGNHPPVLSVPKTLSVTGGERVEFTLQSVDAEGDSVRYYSEGLPRGASLSDTGEFEWKADFDQTGEHKIKFYADDGTSASVSETSIHVQSPDLTLTFQKVGTVRADAGERFSRKLRARSSSGEPVSFVLEKSPEGMRVESGALVWVPDRETSGTFEAVVKASDGYVTERQTVTFQVRSVAEQEAEMASVEWELPEKSNVYVDGNLKERETRRFRAQLPRGSYTFRAELLDGMTGWTESVELKPGEEVRLEAPRLEFGKLSVYFLGGVGELRVNGKIFGQQPPFSSAKVPVGTHRLSCRMASEKSGRSIEITIEKDRETIVEYEVGSDPVVSIE